MSQVVTIPQKKKVNTKKINSKKMMSVLEVLCVLLIVIFLFLPIFWIVLTAFKPESEVYTTSIFFQATLDNFRTVFGSTFNLGKYYSNSLIVVAVTLLITIPVSILASYSLSRFQMPFKQIFMFTILATQFIPLIVNVIPFFTMFRDWGMLDTTLALIIVNLGHTIPYAIWLTKGFIDRIPIDMEEAATIDGANRLQVLWHILLPLAKPGIITATVFCFVITWNEFMFSLVITQQEAVTLPIALSFFNGEEGVLWNQMAAAGIIFVLPTVIFMLLVRKQFILGMTSGGIK
ncbi:carbohydrate ABC transporter permease [Peribacillus simplex]|jgi:multiple sugar transport system permease protein|uniref:Carbohydrate ABC transporter permease n=1 Tax=Peribacillus simplex TaxID=1478 RepID=A0A9X8ZDI9_9BACI|nr:carbohydrate ABC transporter permease [Peribacillus simplex]TKH03155.1 carbohydrate ABC transporter permease [Peribacillus simplex]TKH07874.1 carbohydrate ABC transporter permease [Peribacillus simplex]